MKTSCPSSRRVLTRRFSEPRPKSLLVEQKGISMAAALEGQRNDWDDLASLDPLWAILTAPDAQFGKWDLPDFFKTGVVEISHLMDRAQKLGHPKAWESALDFGCGVGRLTRALGTYFLKAKGLDISPVMIRRANEYCGGFPACEFAVNESGTLASLDAESFDLVYTNEVLQHLPHPQFALNYIREFLRVLKRGGLLVFQLPHFIPVRRRIQPRRRLYRILSILGISKRYLYEKLRLNPTRLIFVPKEQVLFVVKKHAARCLDIVVERLKSHEHSTYFITK